MDRPIGVVTVTFNSDGVIRPFMDSLLKQGHKDFRLYVVDNASSDGTLRSVAEYRDPRTVVIANQENVGVAEGNNIGIRAALKDGCESVLLINNDTVFGSDLISGLRNALVEHKCEMVVPKMLFFDEPDRIWCAGGEFSHWRGTARHFGFCEADDGRFDELQVVEYSPTCCVLIKRAVFDKVGLMDANYFAYFDDTDFCLRAYRAGITMFYIPGLRLFHKVSSLVGRKSETALRLLTRNHVYHVLKNYNLWMRPYYLTVCQVHALGRSLFGSARPKAFLVAERAFWEGLLAYRSRSSGRTYNLREPSSMRREVPSS